MVAKRKGDFVECKTSKVRRKTKAEEVHVPNSLLHLPLDVLTKILLKLPIKSVLSYKCVCKSWLSIISRSHFVQLYSESSPVCAFLRTYDEKRVSRNLHLLNFDELGSDEAPTNSLGSNKWGGVCPCTDSPSPDCDNHMKLDVRLNIPLRDAKMVVHTKHEARRRGNRTTRIACDPKNDRLTVGNSCNGLLLLFSRTGLFGCVFHPLTVIVCNPITGEFIRLPRPENGKMNHGFFYHHYGLGYLKKTDEYKVIHLFKKMGRPISVEIHTLGTNKVWRNIECGESWYSVGCPTYMNGSLHWFVRKMKPNEKASVLYFDLETEMPKSFSCHSALSFRRATLGFGELKGSLFICCTYKKRTHLRVWTMKEYGDSDSWIEIFRFDINVSDRIWPLYFFPNNSLFKTGDYDLF